LLEYNTLKENMGLTSHDDDVVNFSPEDYDDRKVQPVLQAQLAKAKKLSRLRQYSTTSTLPDEDRERQYSSTTLPDEDEGRRRQYSSTLPDKERRRHFSSTLYSSTLPDDDDGRRRQYSSTTVEDEDTKGSKVEGTSPICCQCSLSKPSVKCSHCLTLFCKRCFEDVHGGVKVLGSHKGLPLDDPIDVELQKCPDHSRILEYWCDQDGEAICHECALLGSHKGHTVQKLKERNLNVIKEMEAAYPLAKSVFEALMKSRKLVLEYPQNQIENVQEEAQIYFQEQQNLLNKKQYEVNLKIEDFGNKVTTDSNAIMREIDSKADDLQRWLERSQRCLSNNLTTSVTDENGNKLDITQLSQNLKISTELTCCLTLPILSFDLTDNTFNYQPPQLKPIGVPGNLITGITDLGKKVENEFKNSTNPQNSKNDTRNCEYSNPQIDQSANTEQKTTNNASIQEDIKQRKVLFQEVPNTVCDLELGEWIQSKWGNIERVTTPQFENPLGTAKVATFKTVKAANSCLNSKSLEFKGIQLTASLFLTKAEKMEKERNNEEDIKQRKVLFQEVPNTVSDIELGEWIQSQWGNIERITTPQFHNPPGTAKVATFKTVKAANSCLNSKSLEFKGIQLTASLFLTKAEKMERERNNVQGIRGNPTKIYKTSVYCTYLPKNITAGELKNHMMQFGFVQFVKISINKSGSLYGIIEFFSEKGKIAAIQEKKHVIQGKNIKIESYGDRQSINLLIKKDDSKKVGKLDENGPLSSSTPLNTSICTASCEVSKAEYKRLGKVDSEIEISKKSICIQKIDQEMSENCESVYSQSDKEDDDQQLTLSELINTKNEEITLKAGGDYEAVETKASLLKSCLSPNGGWNRPELPKNTSIQVQMTHFDEKGTVWVLPIDDLKTLQSITKELTNYCLDLISRPDQIDWSPGERAVMFHDGFYKRAEIVAVTSDKSGCRVTVVLVDNGMKIVTDIDQLLVAPGEGLAFDQPSLALPVRLYGVAMSSAPLQDTDRKELIGKMRLCKSTLTQAWMADQFPLSGVVRYRDEQGSDGGNLAQDFIKLRFGKLLTSFIDWEEDIRVSGLDWMMTHEGLSPPISALPPTIPLRSGLWLPVSTETLDFQNNLLGLHPRFSQDLDLNHSFVDVSLIEASFASFLLRKSKYQQAAESCQTGGLHEEGDNVLVFSFNEWHRGVVQASGCSDGPVLVYLPDFHFLDTVEEENIRKMPVGLGWHLDPVQVIKARFLLKGNESSDEIEILRDMLEFHVDFVEIVGIDQEKQEIVAHFYDSRLNLII